MSTSATTPDQDRILTFLSMLDDEVAEHTLRSMDPEVSAKLRQLLSESKTRRTSPKNQRRVLDEFDRFFRFAVKFAAPTLKVHNPNKIAADGTGYKLTDDALEDLEQMNVFQLTSALEEESPRTAAILMKEMSAERNATILGLMRDDLRDAVVVELSLNPTAPAVLVQQVALTTVERAVMLPAERVVELDPIERIAEVLRATDKPARKQMLKRLQDQDADMAGQIQKLLYRFADITELDDVQVRSVLGKIETATIATALFECEEKILNKVMSNLSKRARQTLEEELSFLSRVPETQLKQAREQVTDAIAEAEMEAE